MKKSMGTKVGEYTLVSKCMNTISEQTIIDYYNKDTKLRTTVVEKETRDNQGTFVRLVGSSMRHKEGYPPLVFDSGIMNIHDKKNTGFSAFMPTVIAKEHVSSFDSYAQEHLREKNLAFFLLNDTANIPDYLKKIPDHMRRCGFNVKREGEHPDLIEELRELSFAAYDEVLKLDPSPCPVEEFADFLINEQSKKEHTVFKGFGLSVPSKVQKAFFTLFAERTEFAE